MVSSRVKLFLVLMLGCLLVTAPSCKPNSSNPNNPQQKTLRIATVTWVGYAPIYLAQEKGFFEGVDVHVVRIEDTAARRAALRAGSVDGATDIVDSFTNALSAGLDAKCVLKLDDSTGGDGIVAKNDITSIEGLRGRTVAYPPGQPSHFFLISVLAKHGMTIKDIESRHMEADQAGVAFISGDVDAAVTWEPWLTKAKQKGKVLTTSRERPGLIVDIFTVKNDYYEQHPESIEQFARGWFRAVDYWRANTDESNQIMAKALDLELDEFETMVSGVQYSDLANNQDFFASESGEPSEFHDLLGKANKVWTDEGVIEVSIDPGKADGSEIVTAME